MPDDTDDKLPDPAQVVAVEPRNAVEAAADPAHGGGMSNTEAAMQDYGAMANQSVPSTYLGEPTPAPHTISSGIARFAEAYDSVLATVNGLGDFVGEMEGDAVEGISSAGIMVTAGTAGAIHDLAGGYNALFARMADLVKRAKAAHG